ncbi:MAG: universal stress protein [Deltaproteobacteria bacterium]|nr:universal stress protein [Deltaproteobacteria bacterium]
MLSKTDCHLTLFHCIRNLSHYVPEEILKGAEELQDFWKSKAGEQIAPFMEKARQMIMDWGFTPEQVDLKIADGSRSAADDILTETRNGGYGTVVIGRHGHSCLEEFVFGSVSGKVLQHFSSGAAIWIVQ